MAVSFATFDRLKGKGVAAYKKGDYLAAKLQEVRATLMRRRHEPVAGQARWLASVVRGYLNYHAV